MKRVNSGRYGLRARIVMPLLVIGLLLTVSGAFFIQRDSEQSFREQMTERAGAIARAICQMAEITSDEGTLQRFVASIAAENDVKLVVVAAGDPLVVVSSSRTDWIGRTASDLPDPEHTFQDLRNAVDSQKSSIEFEHDIEDTVDFTIPLRTRLRAPSALRWAHGAVMLHIDGRPLSQLQAQWTRKFTSTLGLAVSLAALAVYGMLQFIVVRPVRQIAKVAQLVANGDRTARVGIKRSDELGELSANMDTMLEELIRRETLEADAKQESLAAQKRLEAALAELSCSNFALDQHAIVAVTDLSGKITYINDRFCEISQYTRDELLGKNHRLVNSGHHPKSFWVEMWRTVVRGGVWRNEVCNRAKDGSLYWVDTTIVPYIDGEGQITKLVAIRSDITARKKAEVELRKSQERFDLAVNGSNDGIWDWTISTDEFYFSPRFKELLGYADNEFPDHLNSFKDRLHPYDAPETWEAVHQHIDFGAPFDVIYRLSTKSGEWRWFRAKGAAIRDADGLVRRMAGSISDVTALKNAENRLAKDALIDGLTGLPNRKLLLERLRVNIEQSKISEFNYALLFLDFDRFKLINDSLGHEAGDDLLRQIADRLKKNVRSEDSISRTAFGNTSARLGGDEFVVLLPDLKFLEDAVQVGERLLSVLAAPYQLNGHEVFSTVSIGTVFGNPGYVRAEDVLRDADTAMYEAKRAGKGCQVVFDEAMRDRVMRRQQLESDLHRAIQAGELSVDYQPIVEVASGAVHSLEALCRWKHPTLGFISPAEFIPIAEESGLISELGTWVLTTACRQLDKWRVEIGRLAPPRVAVNLSRKQLGQPGFAEVIRETFREFKIEPSSIELEVTEDALGGDLPTATKILESLKQVGVKLAIDDFGVGSSSFAALHRFPIDTLKIDRSLLTDFPKSKESAAMVQGLVAITESLGIMLVAEGIEEREQLFALQDLGCKLAQGYYFSRPLPAEKMTEFLQKQTQIIAPTMLIQEFLSVAVET
jgi:diguanylate cyclase (GGDEF)-like protein/PAS domain S-box-containing protein